MADLVENRSASWQPRELEELLEGVQQNYEVLWGKLSGTLSKKDKDRAWSDIVQSWVKIYIDMVIIFLFFLH